MIESTKGAPASAELPRGVWLNGSGAYQDLNGRTFAPWGPFAKWWRSRRAEFPRSRAEAEARAKPDAS